MSYFVTVTYDIKNEGADTYAKIAAKLEDFGLFDKVVGSSKKSLDLPMNTFAGEFTGDSSKSIRDDISELINNFFKAEGIKGRVFIFVGDSWAWGIRNT